MKMKTSTAKMKIKFADLVAEGLLAKGDIHILTTEVMALKQVVKSQSGSLETYS